MTAPFLLAVALDGAGWHPAAWRDGSARPAELFAAGYWTDLAQAAEAGGLDFFTIDDSLILQSAVRGVPDHRVDQVRGRLDAVLIAARVAPTTRRIGIVPVATTTHTEPFHISKSIATLDFVSLGRAGVQVRVSGSDVEAVQFGRRTIPHDRAELFEEAADFVEVMRRLWDSWEDGAEIRDRATGRFIDRDRLHYIDFEGARFSVRGPSITPRPPQGQPIVTALAHNPTAYLLAARSADAVFVTPHDPDTARTIEVEVRQAEAGAGRSGHRLLVLADLVVFLDDQPGRAADRLSRLDQLDGAPFRSDAHVFAGTPEELADLLVAWHVEGMAGFRLRPGSLPRDLEAVSERLVPLLRARGLRPDGYTDDTLRARLGFERPENRYATTSKGANR